jgi:hypothetical protein
MTEQVLWNEARDTAETLVRVHGFEDAKLWVAAQMDYGPKNTQGYWLHVWRELKAFRGARS